METDNWDAALVMRANELLVEVRRYHVDAEATRLQLASAAASMTRKVDELPAAVRQVVEEALHSDSSIADRALLAQRLDRSSRMLDELANQFSSSGLLFLKRSRRASMILIFIGVVIGIAFGFWAVVNGARIIRISAEILNLQESVMQLRSNQNNDNQPMIKTCFNSSRSANLCTGIDEISVKS